jgi:creatinine amidohydrolase
MEDMVWLEKMTWPEIEAALGAGKRTAVVTAGSTEQHGPHLTLATDALLSESLAEAVALRIGDALVAPVIRPGCSEHHMAFPGTISLPPALLEGIVLEYCKCLAHHGFRRLVVMATHGGNFSAVHRAAQAAAKLLGPQGVQVISLAGDLEGFAGALMDPLRKYGLEPKVKVNHADVSETSLIMATFPDHVRPDRLQKGFEGELDVEALLKGGSSGGGLRAVTANGVLGDVEGSSAEVGRAVLESVVGYLVGVYRDAIRD